MHIYEKVLQREEFLQEPPVLLDLGASGGLHKIWQRIAPYAVCIAFDADNRQMEQVGAARKTFRNLIIFNKAVVADSSSSTEFFLTRNPYCSSTLQPYSEALSNWAFADYFEVIEEARLETTNLGQVLSGLNLKRVDWFKADTQGTDLRLFQSLPSPLQDRVLVAEFEPGIIDAYKGEDKLWQVMAFMDGKSYWMTDMEIKGSQRVPKDAWGHLNRIQRKFIGKFIRTAPGWAEICYMNTFVGDFDKREYLLGCVFALLKEQYGFAIKLASKGYERSAILILTLPTPAGGEI